MSRTSPLADVAICAWFLVAAAAYWAPSFGFALPIGPLNALYAVFLLVSLTVLTLRLLRQNNQTGDRIPRVPLVDLPKEDALHRGR
ncbi:MAG: hypothetical protein V4671_06450 [Armatimonadota bacterium]